MGAMRWVNNQSWVYKKEQPLFFWFLVVLHTVVYTVVIEVFLIVLLAFVGMTMPSIVSGLIPLLVLVVLATRKRIYSGGAG